MSFLFLGESLTAILAFFVFLHGWDDTYARSKKSDVESPIAEHVSRSSRVCKLLPTSANVQRNSEPSLLLQAMNKHFTQTATFRALTRALITSLPSKRNSQRSYLVTD